MLILNRQQQCLLFFIRNSYLFLKKKAISISYNYYQWKYMAIQAFVAIETDSDDQIPPRLSGAESIKFNYIFSESSSDQNAKRSWFGCFGPLHFYAIEQIHWCAKRSSGNIGTMQKERKLLNATQHKLLHKV